MTSHKKSYRKQIIAVYGLVALLAVINLQLYSLQGTTTTDGRAHAWEQAPPWMWPLSLLLPSYQAPASSLKLSTFALPSATPTLTTTPIPTPIPGVPTNTPAPTAVPGAPTHTPTPIPPPAGTIPVTTPRIGGPVPPSGYYCIDDVDPDMCDDNSSHLVPKGAGGVSGTCGTVIGNAHNLVDALPQDMKGTRDSLSKAVSTTCGSTGPASGYVSTHFVIDAYNLTGFSDLSKSNANHVSPSGLFSWWQSAPAGYTFIPNSPTVVQQFASGEKDLTGCVMFLSTGSSYHIGIVNKLELYSPGGDGVISILQSGTSMYIDRFPIVGWSIANTSTNQTNTSGVTGFGCRS